MDQWQCRCCPTDCFCPVCEAATPCCIRAVVSGLAPRDGSPTCYAADDLNGTYDLPWQEEPTGIPTLWSTAEGIGCEWAYPLDKSEQFCDYTWALFRIEYRTTGGTTYYYPFFALTNDDGTKFVLFLDNAVAAGDPWDRACMAWDDSEFDTIVLQQPADALAVLDLTDAAAEVTAYENVNDDGTCAGATHSLPCAERACITGEACEEYTVTIAGLANDTCECTPLNGTYVVQRATTLVGYCCRWTYSFGETYSCPNCGNNAQGVYLNLCYNENWPAASRGRIEVGFFSGGLQDDPTCYYPTFRHTQAGKIDCQNLTAQSLTPYTAAAQGCDTGQATCNVTGNC